MREMAAVRPGEPYVPGLILLPLVCLHFAMFVMSGGGMNGNVFHAFAAYLFLV